MPNFLKRMNLRWKITLIVVLIFFLSFSLIEVYIYYSSFSDLRQYWTITLEELSNSLKQRSYSPLSFGYKNELQKLTKEAVEREDLPVKLTVFLDESNSLLAESPENAFRRVSPEVNLEEAMTRTMTFDGDRSLVKVTPVKDVNGKKIATLIVGLSMQPIANELRTTTLYSTGLLVVLLILSSFLAYFFVNGVTGTIVRKIKTIADGNLSESSQADEIIGGEIGKAFRNMRRDLSNIVESIRESALQIDRTSEYVLDASEELKSVAGDQSDQLSDSSSAVTQLSQSVQEVAERTDSGREVAENSQQIAEQAGEQMAQAIDEMQTIQDSVSETSETIEQLGDSGDEIGKIVEVISQIADQTSLLALNAAIEAARAGEQGQGFAVVADEVSRLADRVGESADEIEELIEEIQELTRRSVDSMSTVTEQVSRGASVIDDAGGALEEIRDAARDTLDKMEAISHSMREQAKASDEVAENMENVRAASGDVVDSAEDLVKEGESLEDLSHRMREIVEKFNLD